MGRKRGGRRKENGYLTTRARCSSEDCGRRTVEQVYLRPQALCTPPFSEITSLPSRRRSLQPSLAFIFSTFLTGLVSCQRSALTSAAITGCSAALVSGKSGRPCSVPRLAQRPLLLVSHSNKTPCFALLSVLSPSLLATSSPRPQSAPSRSARCAARGPPLLLSIRLARRTARYQLTTSTLPVSSDFK